MVAKAEAICSQVIFDAWMICSQSVLEAKTNCLVAVREAKTTRDHSIHQAEAACSKAICKAAALKVSQSITFHKEHDRFIWDLEEHAIEDESQSHHDLLSAYQAALSHNPQPLRGAMATSYHLLLGQAPPSSPTILPQKACTCRRTAIHGCSSSTNTQTVSQAKKVPSFTRANGEHTCGGRTSQPQEVGNPSLVQISKSQSGWCFSKGLRPSGRS